MAKVITEDLKVNGILPTPLSVNDNTQKQRGVRLPNSWYFLLEQIAKERSLQGANNIRPSDLMREAIFEKFVKDRLPS